MIDSLKNIYFSIIGRYRYKHFIYGYDLLKKNPTSASLTFAFTPLKHDILKIDSRDMLEKQIMNMVFSSSSCHPNDTALFDGNFSQCSTVDILQIAQTPASLPCVSHAAATLMTFTFVFFAVPLFWALFFCVTSINRQTDTHTHTHITHIKHIHKPYPHTHTHT